MALSLDLEIFAAVLALSLSLVLTNYVVYVYRGRPRLAHLALLVFVLGLAAIGVVLGLAVVALADQYGADVIVARWGFTIGWAFLLALAAGCAAILERRTEGKVSVTFNVAATLLLGFGLAGGLIAGPEVPAFPASLVSLALAGVFTAIFRWTLDRRYERRRRRETLLARFLGRFARKRRKRGVFGRLSDFFRG